MVAAVVVGVPTVPDVPKVATVVLLKCFVLLAILLVLFFPSLFFLALLLFFCRSWFGTWARIRDPGPYLGLAYGLAICDVPG